jgi:adenylate cyclase
MFGRAATGKAKRDMDGAYDAVTLRKPVLARLPDLAWRFIAAGTGGYDTETRRGLVVANITGYLASLSSLSYALNYALHDWTMLWPLVVGNVVSALCTGLVPLFHRLGPAAAGIWLSAVIFTTIFYFIAYLGRESGIQLNYLGTAPVALAILGLRRIRLAGAIALVALASHLAAWFWFPRAAAVVQADPSFMDQIYALTAVSLMAIIFVVVFYALRLAHLAQARTDALLHNIMPSAIADRLKEHPGETIAERYEDASVIFADLKGFTPLAAALGPARVVALLDEVFSAFDAAAARTGIEKIKTIGDAYMAVAGLPQAKPDHAAAAVELACDMVAAARRIGARHGLELELRVGIASGPVMAGVIGRSKFSYDAWGETVNLAARLQTAGRPGHIHISQATRKQLPEPCRASGFQVIELKGIGAVETCFIEAAGGRPPHHGPA